MIQTVKVNLLLKKEAAGKLMLINNEAIFNAKHSIFAKSDAKITTGASNFMFHRIFVDTAESMAITLNTLNTIVTSLNKDEFVLVMGVVDTLIKGEFRDPTFTLDKLIEFPDNDEEEVVDDFVNSHNDQKTKLYLKTIGECDELITLEDEWGDLSLRIQDTEHGNSATAFLTQRNVLALEKAIKEYKKDNKITVELG